jgi:hypothetical protein
VLTTELLEQLAKRWREHGAPVASHLRAGLTAEQMDELTRPLGLHLSSEARTWWGWHDGADPALRLGTERDLGGPLQGFLTLEESDQRLPDESRFPSSREGPEARGDLARVLASGDRFYRR